MKRLSQLAVKNKKVLVRVDLNVPLKNGKVQDDFKIKASLPTINYLLKKKAKVILMTHLGRPTGRDPKLSTKVLVGPLQRLLKRKVTFVADCVGKKVVHKAEKLQPGQVLLLENLRFHAEEKANDKTFGKELAKNADVYVDDAFASMHNKHASIVGVPRYLKNAIGLLAEKEITQLSKATTKPKRPYVAIMGGAKVKDKIKVIKALLKKVDMLLIGGAMMFTFLKAQGYEVGKSLVDKEGLPLAKKLLRNKKIVLPVDAIVAARVTQKGKVVAVDHIPKNMIGLDIGPKTVKLFKEKLKGAKTVVWNGPLGMYEKKQFAKGTKIIAQALAKSKAVTIVGGGDSAHAVRTFKLAKKFTHVSTGGGASLRFFEGTVLPGVKALSQKLASDVRH